jgi:tetratricopeptide (TPR) repeat protein
LYASSNDYEKALGHHLAAKQYAEQSDNILQQGVVNSTMGRVYLNLKKTDSALISEQNAYDLMMLKGYKKYLGTVLLNMGRIYEVMGKKDSAVHFYRRALETSRETYYVRGIAASNLLLADLQKQIGQARLRSFFPAKCIAGCAMT